MKELIELAKKTEVVTVSPEQRARVLGWARRQVGLGLNEQQPFDSNGQRRTASRPSRPRTAGQPTQRARGRRPASRRQLAGAS